MIGLVFLLQVSSDIVVTGQRLVEAQAVCAKRGCTPAQDARLTIALAESWFNDGKYLEAKTLLAKASSRNAKNAAQVPRAVAAIYSAHATVALHEGNKRDYQRFTARQVHTLRSNLPADDPAVLAVNARLGDMWIELGNYREAEFALRTAEKNALAIGQHDAAFLAALKLAWVLAAKRRHAESRALLDDLAARPLASQTAYRRGVAVLRLRLAMGRAPEAEIERLMADVNAASAGSRPMLVFAPRLEPNWATLANGKGNDMDRPPMEGTYNAPAEPYWADVGFWIGSDGHTSQVEVLRGVEDREWLEPALQQIAGRRYSAVAPEAQAGADEPGFYCVERITLRVEHHRPTGSRIMRRVMTGGYDILDLTEPPSASSGRPSA